MPEANPSHNRIVAHVLETFKAKKGAPYPFMAADGRVIKFLLGLYEPETILALWDIFLETEDDWIRKTGHKVSEFQRQVPMLLDRDWKSRARKYTPKQTNEIKIEFKEI